VGGRQSGGPLAATNVKKAGCVCKRHDAVHLGRKEGLQPRASERPAVSCSQKLASLGTSALFPASQVMRRYGFSGHVPNKTRRGSAPARVSTTFSKSNPGSGEPGAQLLCTIYRARPR